MIRSLGTIPAMLDVRIYSPGFTTSGWMDVSPPTRSHSFSRQASEIPFTNAFIVSFSAFPHTIVSSTARGFAPITAISFTRWLIMSWQMDSTYPYSMASFCLEPGSSDFRTSTGSSMPGNPMSYRDAKGPRPLSTRGFSVVRYTAISLFMASV